MDEVRAVLDRAGLAHLSTKFEEIGYDDVTYLRACATDNSMATSWEEIARECELDVAQEWALSDALLGKPKPKPMPMPKPKPKPAAKAAAKATAKAAAKARPPTPEEPWEETAENHPDLGPAKSFAVGTKKTSKDGREWEVVSRWKKWAGSHGKGQLIFWRTTTCPPAGDAAAAAAAAVDDESSSDDGAPEETWEETWLAALGSGPRKRAAAAPASALAPSVAAAPGKRPATTPRAPPEAKATPGTTAAAKSKKRKRSLEPAAEVVAEAEGLALHLDPSVKSGYKGVSQQANRWRARVCVRNKQIDLGRYETTVEAAVAYAKYVQSLEATAAEEEEDDDDQDEEEEEQEAPAPMQEEEDGVMDPTVLALMRMGPGSYAADGSVAAPAPTPPPPPAAPAVPAAPPGTLVEQAARIRSELELDATLTTGAIIRTANEEMGLPATGTLPAQVAALYAAIGIDV